MICYDKQLFVPKSSNKFNYLVILSYIYKRIIILQGIIFEKRKLFYNIFLKCFRVSYRPKASLTSFFVFRFWTWRALGYKIKLNTFLSITMISYNELFLCGVWEFFSLFSLCLCVTRIKMQKNYIAFIIRYKSLTQTRSTTRHKSTNTMS